MKNKFLFACTVVITLLVSCSIQHPKPLRVESEATKENIFIVHKGTATPICIDTCDAEVVSVVAHALASDIERITGIKPPVISSPYFSSEYMIIAGTIGKSAYIDDLILAGKLDVSTIESKWECFKITTVANPAKGIKKAIVIAGSDRRGTAYGLFEISKLAGVSPWVYWADVEPEKRTSLYLTNGTCVSQEPAVKYRGIFINDEDWGLNVWARKNIDIEIQDIGPETYALMYELLLRLRANFIWPAMHDSTKAFFYYKGNPEMADKYAIVMGSTHCDQMLRSNTFEWQKNFKSEYGERPGPYRYDINKKQVLRYWQDRVNETKTFESVYTIGMRGVRDGSIQGPKTTNDKIALMDTIVADQRGIFRTYFGKEAGVPQIFCPYKEVLDLYNKGFQVPDDVTLVWPDDNYGYIRRLSTPEEQRRSGAAGVYYHLSYMGNPHDYLWLSTISPALIAYEMTKAYQFRADRLWVVNVGDIKPAELELQFFLDMAWDAKNWTPAMANAYIEQWAKKIFGDDLATPIANIKMRYYQLAQTGKPEHLTTIQYNEEMQRERLKESEELWQLVEDVSTRVPEYLRNAFFQLIEYPVKGMALINMKFTYADWSFACYEQDKELAKKYSQKSWQAFKAIKALTHQYNTEIKNGKWEGIITDSPRELKVYGMPDVAVKEVVDDQGLFDRSYDTRYIHRGDVFSVDFSEGEHSILAGNYTMKSDKEDDEVMTINGLGLGGKSISRYPFTNQSYPKQEFQEAPSVSYKVRLEKGLHKVSIKCLPTRSIHKGRNLLLAVVVNGGNPQFLEVHHDRKDKLWKSNVLRGFMPVEFETLQKKDGEVTLTLYLLDTGLAVSRIDFYSQNS